MRLLQSRIMGSVLRRFADPQKLLELGMSFWSSRVVLTAVVLGLFSELAKGPLSAPELMNQLGWHHRATAPFLDSLVGMRLLRRDKVGRYSNSRQSALFLDKARLSYIGGLMELSSKRLYELWSGMENLLRTGRPEAREERDGKDFFSSLYVDPNALADFLTGMTGISTGEAIVIAARFPWKRFRTFLDVGAAQGALAVRVALTHPHLTGAGFDLPAVGSIFAENVASFGLGNRLSFIPGDMNVGPLPRADVICFGHVLHGYGEPKRRELIAKAYAAVPPGGALLIYDAMVTPDSRYNYMSQLSSLNIMFETRDGFEATLGQCALWLRDCGFVGITSRHVIGPTSMVFGYKPGG